MLSIRLQRVGRKNEPTFRVVLTDSKNSTKSGRYLEVLGSFDSRRGEKATVDAEKIKHWISKGAKPSGTVHNLLVERKIITGKKINVLSRKSPIKKESESKKDEGGAPKGTAEAADEAPVEAKATDATEAIPAAPVDAPAAA